MEPWISLVGFVADKVPIKADVAAHVDVERPSNPADEVADKISEEHVDLNSLQEKNIAPVGSEYIETVMLYAVVYTML